MLSCTRWQSRSAWTLRFATLFVVTSTSCPSALAEITWRGDMETGSLFQWTSRLNEDGLSVSQEQVLDGDYSARIEIDDQDLWPNGLNRVELQRKPISELTRVGSEVYFGWSVYLPEELTEDDHQLGYWETDVSYDQIMSLHARGSRLSFNTNRPYVEHWSAEGTLTAAQWHRIVYHVAWSDEQAGGEVSLWFDGQKVVDSVGVQTYLGNPAFIQLGILRTTIAEVETLYVDEALEGTSLYDVALDDRLDAGVPSAGGSPSLPTFMRTSSSGCAHAPARGTSKGAALSVGMLFLAARRRLSANASPHDAHKDASSLPTLATRSRTNRFMSSSV